MKKRVIVTHFTMKIVRMYPYIISNKKFSFVKIYLSLLWLFTDFSIVLFLLPEHKHCHNAATNCNNENARSRMVASLQGIVGTGTTESESSTGRVWAAAFHHFTVRSGLARILKLMNCLFL